MGVDSPTTSSRMSCESFSASPSSFNSMMTSNISMRGPHCGDFATYQWRKYGKKCNKTKGMFCTYFRCFEKGCNAKKHVFHLDANLAEDTVVHDIKIVMEHNHLPPRRLPKRGRKRIKDKEMDFHKEELWNPAHTFELEASPSLSEVSQSHDCPIRSDKEELKQLCIMSPKRCLEPLFSEQQQIDDISTTDEWFEIMNWNKISRC